MTALEIDTAHRIEESEVPDDFKRLLLDTGLDLTGIDPEEIKNIAKSFERGVHDFRNPARRILRGDIDPPEF